MLGLLSMFYVLLGAVAAQTPSTSQYSITCPYISSNTCTLKPPLEAECKVSLLGECSKAPSSLVSYYFITNVTGTNLTYRRFKDDKCTQIEPQWTTQGQLGACIGPIDQQMGFNVFVTINLYNGTVNTTTTSSDSASPTSSSPSATTASSGASSFSSAPSVTVASSGMSASTTSPAAATASWSTSSSPTASSNPQKTSAGSALPIPLFVVIFGVTLVCLWLFA
eukprot:comp19347_c0_seq1/m.22276 comp19347_c0_seq1/g.22276  ORF comp19347_c0_seq1/g.22276 comp19347_c0_seq1/m.22276 type:complete len:223 (-) comp19347_c0_seq1:307-975(-)